MNGVKGWLSIQLIVALIVIAGMAPAAERERSLSGAVYRGNDPDTGLTDLWLATLSKQATLKVLDRSDMRAILGELSLTGVSDDSARQVRLGRLLGVEYFAWIKASDDQALMEVVEAATGRGVLVVPVRFSKGHFVEMLPKLAEQALQAASQPLPVPSQIAPSIAFLIPRYSVSNDTVRASVETVMADLSGALASSGITMLSRRFAAGAVQERWRQEKGLVEDISQGQAFLGADYILGIAVDATNLIEMIMVETSTGRRIGKKEMPLEEARTANGLKALTQWGLDRLKPILERSSVLPPAAVTNSHYAAPEILKSLYAGMVLHNQGRYIDAIPVFEDAKTRKIKIDETEAWIVNCYRLAGFPEIADAVFPAEKQPGQVNKQTNLTLSAQSEPGLALLGVTTVAGIPGGLGERLGMLLIDRLHEASGMTVLASEDSATLQTAWFSQAGVTLVERDAVQKIVQEHQLAAANLTAMDSRLQLGRIIPADVLLFVQCVQGMPQPATRLDLTESRTGITLGSWIREDAEIQAHTAAVMAELGEALQKRRVPTGQRHLIGLLEFRGEESGLELENQAIALGELAMPAIGRIPNVIVLDREHLDHLRTEKELTALDQELRASLWLLEGGLRRTPDRKGLGVTVVLRPLAGGVPQNRTFDVLTNDIVGARTRVAAAVVEMLKTSPPKALELDRAKEAALFGEQARCWDKWGDHARAVRAAEAGFALDDSQTCRFLLIQTLVSEPEPALSASVRANQLLLDYYARQRESIASGGTTNLLLPEIGYSPALAKPDIRARDSDAAQQLVRLENEAFRTRLALYTRYYPQTDNAFWNTWHARLLSYKTAAPGDIPRQAGLFWEGVQTFLKSPNNEETVSESRLKVLLRLVPGSFHEVIEKMIAHKDPYVRLVGHHARLSALGWNSAPRTVSREEIESRGALFDIVLNEIGIDHRYREFRKGDRDYYREFSIMGFFPTPQWIECERGILPKEEFEHELDQGIRLIKQVIDGGDAARFEAWQRGDHLIAWLDFLATYGRATQALNLADKIMAMPKGVGEGWDSAGLAVQRERYARMVQGHAAESPHKVVSDDGAAWKDHEIRPLPFRIEIRKDPYFRELPPLICSEGSLFGCIVPAGKAINISVFGLPTGALVHKRAVRLDPPAASSGNEPSWSEQNILAVALHGDTCYVGTSMGLLAVPMNGGDIRLLTVKDGLPGKLVRAVGWYGDRLYLGIGDNPWADAHQQAAVFASYDPRSRNFDILASEKKTVKKTPLDGERFGLDNILGDPERACIWLFDRETGIWKFDPESNCFEPVKIGNKTLILSGTRLTERRLGQRTPSLFIPSLATAIDLPFSLEWAGQILYQDNQYVAAYDGTTVMGCASTTGQSHQEFFLLCERQSPARLPKAPDGSALPEIVWLQKTAAGVVAMANHGQTFLIRRKNRGAAYRAAELTATTGKNLDSRLLLATAEGRTEDVGQLIADGANLESADRRGCTPLIQAIQGGHQETRR